MLKSCRELTVTRLKRLHSNRAWLILALAAGLTSLLGWASGGNAQTITEYALPYGDPPRGITAGPDGAIWFTGPGIGRITTSGVVTFPSSQYSGERITAGPDGALWYTDIVSNSIGRISVSGHVTEYPVPTNDSYLNGITTGPDGALWFTEFYGNKIGRITTGGALTEYPLTGQGLAPLYITVGPDGALWFTNSSKTGGGQIGRITTAGVISEFPLSVSPFGLTTGPDGALWFTTLGSDQPGSSLIGRVTTAGAVTLFPIGTSASAENEAITGGPDGALWFVEYSGNKIGRITTSGKLQSTRFPRRGLPRLE